MQINDRRACMCSDHTRAIQKQRNRLLEDSISHIAALDTVHIHVCGTCLDTAQSGADGIGAGAELRKLLNAELQRHPAKARAEISAVRCLMACTTGCAVSISSPGKMKYLLGHLSADADDARRVLDFVQLYADSPMGVTSNHAWPDDLGRHFIGRIPPDRPNDPDWSDEGSDL